MNHYTCPNCSVHLNVDGRLVLAIKTSDGRHGVVLMSDTLGDYNVHHHPSLNLQKGEKTNFYCPSFKGSLDYQKDKDMVRIFMQTEDGEEHTIIFSAIYGDQATFQISEERSKSYGEMAHKFLDPEWYLKDD